ncbi:hypothetical protein F5Y06DRAFT_306580 [Hypoxylon sp. FL0890]|nr:hypothetical protein F5Y06DRAFT_306580 [Hypoxylon sp. FL0890]
MSSMKTLEPIIDGPRPSDKPPRVDFDPEKHLQFEPPSSVLTWEDLGYPKDHGISPIAVCQPFRLFSDDAIQQMRAEIFQQEVMENYRASSTIAAMQVRGYAEKHAPFIYAAWKHPKTLELLSKVAGIDLSIKVDHEIGHLNFAVKPDDKPPEANPEIPTAQYSKEREVVGWHYDSYPYSCVTMLSDGTNMVGGETVMQLKNGQVLKLDKPKLGYAVVLQGRYVLHKGLTASGGKERISMVTSLWPRSPFVKDETFLTNIRTVSNNDELYIQFAEYRLEMLEERTRAQLKKIRDARLAGGRISTTALKHFIAEQQQHLTVTDAALLEEEKVERGIVKEIIVNEPIPTY